MTNTEGSPAYWDSLEVQHVHKRQTRAITGINAGEAAVVACDGNQGHPRDLMQPLVQVTPGKLGAATPCDGLDLDLGLDLGRVLTPGRPAHQRGPTRRWQSQRCQGWDCWTCRAADDHAHGVPVTAHGTDCRSAATNRLMSS